MRETGLKRKYDSVRAALGNWENVETRKRDVAVHPCLGLRTWWNPLRNN